MRNIAKQKNFTPAGYARNAVTCGRYGLTDVLIVMYRSTRLNQRTGQTMPIKLNLEDSK